MDYQNDILAGGRHISTMESIYAMIYERGYKCNGDGSKANMFGGDKTWMIEYQRRICI